MKIFLWTRATARSYSVASLLYSTLLLSPVCASLFDSLPMNGALVPEDLTSNQTETWPASNSSLAASEASPKETGRNGTSLFDQLPYHGALAVTTKLPESKPTGVTYSVTNSRNQRQSFSKTAKRSFTNFEIERQPTADLDLAFFNSHLLPSVVKTLTEPVAPFTSRFPILSSSTLRQREHGGYTSSNQNNRPQVVPEPVVLRQVKLTNAVRNGENAFASSAAPLPTGASAASGGSTVIVYANPPPSSTGAGGYRDRESTVTSKVAYGPPPERSTSAPPKPEVHYHYYITNNRVEAPATTKAPSTQYGPPPKSTYEPPSEEYGPPAREYEAPRTTAPPSVTYGPPKSKKPAYGRVDKSRSDYNEFGSFQRTTSSDRDNFEERGGYSRGGYTDSGNRNEHTNRGGYGESGNRGGYSNGNSRNHNQSRRPSESYGAPATTPTTRETEVPVITGGTVSVDNNPGGYQDQTSSSSSTSEFNSRTLLTSLQVPAFQSSYSSSYSNNPAPAPSPAYGPPPSNSETFTTGSPPVSQEPFNPPQQTAQTSITLETIPITTTETRFVTVPKIVQTLGTTLRHSPEQLNSPPVASAQYGAPAPPAPPQAIRDITASAREILDEHLAQLNPRGISTSSLSEISDLELLNLLQQNSRGNQIAAILTPSQSQSSDVRNLPPLFSSSSLTLSNGGNSESRVIPQSISLNQSPLLQSDVLNGNSGARYAATGSSSLQSESSGVLSDFIREQRLQLALADVRTRLRQQSRAQDRNRQAVRNLFYKGALLMAGLTLIPSVASVGSGKGPVITPSLVPLSAGRRRRSVTSQQLFVDVPKTLPSFSQPEILPSPTSKSELLNLPTILKFSGNLSHQSRLKEGPKSTCAQRRFCDTLQAVWNNRQVSMAFLQTVLPPMSSNQVLKDAFRAAKKGDCHLFSCENDEESNA